MEKAIAHFHKSYGTITSPKQINKKRINMNIVQINNDHFLKIQNIQFFKRFAKLKK